MGVLQLLKVQSRESGCVGFARPEHTPMHGSSFSPTGLQYFPSTWGLWFREQAKMAVKDDTAISKGNRICLSTNVIFNNLTGMNYRSGCFLSEAVTTKKLRFQLPSLLIFKPCFRLCKLVSLSTHFYKSQSFSHSSFLSHISPTPKDAAGSYKMLQSGTLILSYSCSTSRAVNIYHRANTCVWWEAKTVTHQPQL